MHFEAPYIEGINLPHRFERQYSVISCKGLLRHSPLPYNNQYTWLFKKNVIVKTFMSLAPI